jgi:hypothetical protein
MISSSPIQETVNLTRGPSDAAPCPGLTGSFAVSGGIARRPNAVALPGQ